MEKEKLNLLMKRVLMKDNLKIMKLKEKEYINGKMEIFMKDK